MSRVSAVVGFDANYRPAEPPVTNSWQQPSKPFQQPEHAKQGERKQEAFPTRPDFIAHGVLFSIFDILILE